MGHTSSTQATLSSGQITNIENIHIHLPTVWTCVIIIAVLIVALCFCFCCYNKYGNLFRQRHRSPESRTVGDPERFIRVPHNDTRHYPVLLPPQVTRSVATTTTPVDTVPNVGNGLHDGYPGNRATSAPPVYPDIRTSKWE